MALLALLAIVLLLATPAGVVVLVVEVVGIVVVEDEGTVVVEEVELVFSISMTATGSASDRSVRTCMVLVEKDLTCLNYLECPVLSVDEIVVVVSVDLCVQTLALVLGLAPG